VGGVPDCQLVFSELVEVGLRWWRLYGVQAREQERDSGQVMPIPSPLLVVPR
jgi:hypothetical protein